ncbi:MULTISPECIES: DUF4242 domain-containing protein [Niastella]|uniref:DUF4242 domain-containing protein n=1 Tax=Niastella soli TaxID=2821487 RepID=A0ABS3YTN9_9BACT|nr:DUF4242 domain-containing protein [Niastella soli]MBO9201289.1 DUF4242 domain-containing protein [Niastella soli]
MKDTISYSALMFVVLLLCGFTGKAQTSSLNELKKKPTIMKTYVIEREIPGLGKWTPEQLKSASQTSCNVLTELGPKIEWVHSYVTGNKMYCIYRAENPELIKEHAKKGGFPANSISEVTEVISPATATAAVTPAAN